MSAVLDNLPVFFTGFGRTLSLLGIAGAGAFVVGLLVAALRISPIASFRGFAAVYTEILRNTPLTLVLFCCAYVLPYLGVRMPFFTLAAIGLTAYTSPFIAEAIRSGVNGVAIGQAEAARSIGLGFGQTLRLIVLPQAVRMVVPPLINVYIALTKNTSVAGAFFVIELFAAAGEVINRRGDAVVAILLAVALFYLVITIPLGRLAAAVEKRVAILRRSTSCSTSACPGSRGLSPAARLRAINAVAAKLDTCVRRARSCRPAARNHRVSRSARYRSGVECAGRRRNHDRVQSGAHRSHR